MQNVHFTPPQIAQILGVNVSTIKRWVDKGILPAQKTAGGHRKVSRSDLQKLITEQNITDSYILKNFQNKQKKYNYLDYYQALKDRQYQSAEKIILKQKIISGDVISILTEIISPTLNQIGQDWSEQKISIADEHRISFMIRQHLYLLNEILPKPKSNASKALLACVIEENHELPLQIIHLILKETGWQTSILGINTPAEAIIEEYEKDNYQIICLAKIYRTTKTSFKEIEQIRENIKAKTKIILGGNGWDSKEKEDIKKMSNYNIFSERITDFVKLIK